VIIHKKGNLFDTWRTPNDVYIHAVSCAGVWGAGVALSFQQEFPKAYIQYRTECNSRNAVDLLGMPGIYRYANAPIIAWLYTGEHPGRQKDINKCIQHTEEAVSILAQYFNKEYVTFHSPRINAGLFRVPWELTEACIARGLEDAKSTAKWIVYTL